MYKKKRSIGLAAHFLTHAITKYWLVFLCVQCWRRMLSRLQWKTSEWSRRNCWIRLSRWLPQPLDNCFLLHITCTVFVCVFIVCLCSPQTSIPSGKYDFVCPFSAAVYFVWLVTPVVSQMATLVMYKPVLQSCHVWLCNDDVIKSTMLKPRASVLYQVLRLPRLYCTSSSGSSNGEEGVSKGKEVSLATSSLRMDAVAAGGLDISRKYVKLFTVRQSNF